MHLCVRLSRLRGGGLGERRVNEAQNEDAKAIETVLMTLIWLIRFFLGNQSTPSATYRICSAC